jgi:acetyl-CoA carboxylase, biotin carboxylase subunit
MHRALAELTIVGVETSREFHLRVMEDPEFQRGEIEIQWLERRLPDLIGARPSRERVEAAAIAAALLAERDRQTRRGVPAAGQAGASLPATAGVATPAGDPWKLAARREGLRQ